MNTAAACARANITARQADFWARTGLIPGVASLTDKGSGNPREWTPAQVEFVMVLAQLVRAGIAPRVASDAVQARIAEGVDLGSLAHVTLPGGLVVSVRPRLSAVTA